MASPGAPLPSPGPNDDRGPAVTAIFWSEAAVAVLVVSLRLYARRSIRALGADDWFMLITTVVFVALSCVITYIASLGGSRHLVYVPPQNLSEVAKSNFIVQALTIFTFGTSKFSVGYLILRLLPPNSKWRKWFIWVLIVFTCFYNWLECILTFTQCNPARAQWDPSIVGTCWSLHAKLVNVYVGGGYNIAVDVILALLPTTFIWKLNMDFKKRLNLCILLGLGLLAAICSAVKLSYVSTLGDVTDITWDTYNLNVWSGSEVFVIIVCGSIPPLKVLWDRYVLKQRPSPPASYQYQSADNGYMRMTKGRSPSSSQNRTIPDEKPNHIPCQITATTDIEVVGARNSSL